MKFTILGFQQQKLIDNKLTLEDAFLLSVIKDMYASDRMESIIQDNKRYIWINQAYLLEQIPILGSISKLKRMLNKLCEDGFLESILITNKKGVAGRFYYVKYTSKLSELEDYEIKVQNDTRLEDTKVQNDTRPKSKMTLNQSSKWTNKDSSIIDSSIKDSIYTKEFLEWYSLYPNQWNKQQSFKNFKSLMKNEIYENLMTATKNYIEYIKKKGTDREFIVRSTNFIGQHKEYLGYLEMQVITKDIQVEQKANCGAYKEWRGRKSVV